MTVEVEANVEELLRAATHAEWLASEPAQRALATPVVRTTIYRALHPTPNKEHHGLLQVLLRFEDDYWMQWERWDDEHPVGDDGEACENLYWCALMLHQIGELEDVLPLWRAKCISMDTHCGMDIEYLMGAGLEPTLQYLDASDDEAAPSCAKYIRECAATGHFEAPDHWLATRIEYFDG